MAKKKVYAVKKGRKTGVFLTWEECKALVDGYPGAQYKGFSAMEEAEAYLGIVPKQEADKTAEIRDQVPHETEEALPACIRRDIPGQVVAYVDGSFDVSVGRYSFGCVIITPDNRIIRQFGNGDNPDSVALRNVTGEMLGAMFAVQWCLVNDYKSINICYDYKGVELWVTGAWKAKNDLTQKYASYMRGHAGRISMTFTKIAAHTGDYYNEEADKLAKRGLTEGKGIPKAEKIKKIEK